MTTTVDDVTDVLDHLAELRCRLGTCDATRAGLYAERLACWDAARAMVPPVAYTALAKASGMTTVGLHKARAKARPR